MKLGTIPTNDFQKIAMHTINVTDINLILIRCIVESGCRTDEALKIRPRDFNFTLNTLQIYGSKNSHDRTIKVSPELIKDVRRVIQLHSIAINSELITKATDSKTHKCQRIVLQRTLKRLTTTLGLPNYTLHQIRHTCFDTVYKKLGDVYAVMQFAGHKSINSTLEYVHHNSKDKAQSAWIEALNNPTTETV